MKKFARIIGIIFLIIIIYMIFAVVYNQTNLVTLQIYNDTQNEIRLEARPCDDFCTRFEEVKGGRLTPKGTKTDKIGPLLIPYTYHVVSKSGNLLGCLTIKFTSENKKVILISNVKPCVNT
ncbi:MAG TPA: hypothetical protein VLG67_03335 [Candidatus Saccharimonadales bacterium]|nr:hypothetical protein [Candidatus Saccharimonadales bacterium]